MGEISEVKYLLVVSVTSGRNFPERKDCEVRLEGKFNDEVLYSDPISHSKSPEINTELAWELDKKSLHQHRMQRTPIKMNIQTINNSQIEQGTVL